jgi:uncharacterized membrane protein
MTADESGSQSTPPAERRWPMAAAVLVTAGLRAALPASLRIHDASWMLAVFAVVMLAVLMIGDPGRIQREDAWLRVVTLVMIGVITIVNGTAAVQLVVNILSTEPFTEKPTTLLATGASIWLSNSILFGLWYWELDRGGAAARAHGRGEPSFIFPEMANSQFVAGDWCPRFRDYIYLSFNTALAFSPTDVSAIRPWAKFLMLSEDAISLAVGILVVARAINILK